MLGRALEACVNVGGVQKSTCSKLGATARRVASTRKNHEKTHLGNSSLVFRPLGRRQRRARGRSAVGGLSRKRAYAWKVAPALEHFARVARQHVEHVIRLAPSQPRLRISPLGGVQGTCELPFPASPNIFFFLGGVGVSVFDLNFTVTRVQQRGLLGEQWLKVDFRPFLSHIGGEG